MTKAALTTSHLTRRFGDRLAVDDVSFDVAPGEIFALLGPNGAGKTTILRLLAGLIEPSSGEVRVAGTPMTRATAAHLRSRIGFLTESPGLWDRLSVRENLETFACLHQVSNPTRVVEAALSRFGLTTRANDPSSQLSKGLKQRVALARTLLHEPSVVLLDEPTSGLDPESTRDVRELIARLRREGRAILLSTHHLSEVERLADRVAVLHTSLLAVDTPTALRSRLFGARLRVTVRGPIDRFVAAVGATLGNDVRVDGSTMSIAVDDPSASAPDIVRHLVEAGADVQSVGPDERPLEEVYLALLHERDQQGRPS